MRENLRDAANVGSGDRAAETTVQAISQRDSSSGDSQALTVSARVAAIARSNPRAMALICGEQELTYAELSRRVDQLASHLEMLGVKRGAIVALLVSESVEALVAALAIMKLAAVFLPLDPLQPKGRLDLMVRDSRVALVITDESLQPSASYGVPLCVLGAGLSSSIEALRQGSREQVQAPALSEPACLLYQSSPAGRPQGMLLSHGALCAPGVAVASDRLGLPVSLSHELECCEIFRALAVGATLVHLPGRLLPRRVATLVREKSVTVLWGPLAMASRLALDFPLSLKNVRLFVCEERPNASMRAPQIRAKASEAIIGLYGSIETGGPCAFCTIASVDGDSEAALLKTLAPGTVLHVLNDCLEPVREGATGELYVAADNLGCGYFADPGRTAQTFVPDPFSLRPGARLCRTGDLARPHGDGQLELMGRRDERVTFAGSRIEPQEIETALLRYDGIKEGAVLVLGTSEPPYFRVHAFVVSSAPQLSTSGVERFLVEQLWVPVPVTVNPLPEMPRTSAGAVDREALRAFLSTSADGTEMALIAPRNPLETKLAEIWAAILGRETVGIHDNFFRHGGNSLLAALAVARIGESVAIDLSMRNLFEAPSIAELAVVIEQLIQDKTKKRSSIRLVDRSRPIPLSFAQQRLWFFCELFPDNPFYNLPVLIRLEGPLERAIWERCINEIVNRHEALRTRFENQDGNLVQIIEPPFQIEVQFKDLNGDSEADSKARQLIQQAALQAFDLRRAPLLRCLLLRLSEEQHLFLFATHHIVSDGWSIWVLMRELSALYTAFSQGKPSPLPELPIQYADFAAWQREWLDGDLLESQLAYWKEELEGLPGQLDLPTDRPRTLVPTFHGARHTAVISKTVAEKLKSFSRQEGTTLFMTVLAAFQVLLGRHSGQADFGVGVPIANRERTEIEGLIGFFVNTLVMRARLADRPHFRELLARVRRSAIGAYGNQDLPFEKVVELLRPERDLSRNPLVQVAFAYEEGMTIAMHAGKLQLTSGLEAGTTQWDLITRVFESANGLEVWVEYATDLFNQETIARLLGHYNVLLEYAVTEPELPIGELPLLTQAEQRQLAAWSGQRASYSPVSKCVHALFTEQAAATPGAIAVTCEGQSLTYQELDHRSNRLARRLRRLGIGPDALVGLHTERSLDMVVGLLGILKAGGAYLPLDPSYPPDRLEFMLQDARSRVLLTQKHLPPLVSDAHVILLDEQQAEDDSGRALHEPADGTTTPDNLAYVIYTSGSTGRPKGVPIPHSNVVRLLLATHHWFNFSSSDVWTFFHSYAFDFSVWELWGALAYGGRLVIVPHDVSRSPEEFYKLLCRERVTVLNQTPSAFRQLSHAEETIGQSELSLRLVIFGGEALEISSLRPWFQRHGDQCPQLVNMYGITETTVHVTYRPLRLQDVESGASMIGEQIPDLQLLLANEDLQLVPVGVAGEIYVGGAGLARGYLNRPELTAERFVPDCFSGSSGARLYRSGDRAKWSAGGDIEFLGRGDRQVKIRGFRIELGEIEAALSAHPAVREAIVMLRQTASGDKRLMAYVVPSKDHAGPLLEFLRLEKTGALGHQSYRLPNGRTILHHRKNETDFLYKEVFEDHGYFRHGIELPDEGCVFDVGANIGMFTLFAGWSAKNLRVYAFEPIPEVFDVLSKNCTIHGLNARVFNCGLGREPRTEVFTYYPNLSILSGSHGNLLEEQEVVKSFVSHQLGTSPQAVPVSSTELDELVADRLRSEQCVCAIKTISEIIREENIQAIGLLKVDVEKSELDVLQGIEEDDWGKIRQAVVEIHDRDGVLQRVENLFRSHGFEVVLEQDQSLVNTGLYSLYALRARTEKTTGRPAQPEETALIPMWTSVAQLTADLRESLQQKLPSYMVPAAFVVMESFPLTANGKTDREALPWAENGRAGSEIEFRSPRTAVEEALVGLWCEILELQRIGIEDNWFDLGGHSLLATQLISRIRALFQLELPIRTIFEAPSVSALAQRVEAELRSGKVISAPPIQRRQDAGPAPLSFGQERLWFLDQLQPGGFVYHVPVAARIKGTVDLDALQRSISDLRERHEVLRARFVAVDGSPRQVVEPAAPTPLPLLDLSQAEEAERARRLQEFVMQEMRRPFDLAQGPVFRASLVRLSPEEHLLMLTQHHIVSDAWSLGILWRELGALYEAHLVGQTPPLPSLPIQYSDYAVWQRAWLAGEAWEAGLEYWKNQLQGIRGVLELPADRPRPALQSSNGAMREVSLAPELCSALKALSRSEGVTLFMTLLATFYTLLYRLKGKTDLPVGSPIANRNRPELENLIGFFVNTLVLRTEVSDDLAFRLLLARVREVSLGAYAHQEMPFEKLVEELQPQRDLSHTPLFQVVFAYQNDSIADHSTWHSVSLEPESVHLGMGIAKFDLTLSLEQRNGSLQGFLEYNTDIFESTTADLIIRTFRVLLHGILQDPSQSIADIPILDDAERRNLTVSSIASNTEDFSLEETAVTSWIDEHAVRKPESPAVIFDGNVLTYAELSTRTNRIARWLQSRGVQDGDRIGVALDAITERLVAALGVLKAGGVVVPLEASGFSARDLFVLADAGVGWVVTQVSSSAKFSVAASSGIQLLCLDREEAAIREQSGEALNHGTAHDEPACILYRSGPEGHPEGIVLAHRSLSNTWSGCLRLETSDRVAGDLDFSHDLACLAAFRILTTGACVVHGPGQASFSPRKFGSFLRDHAITVLWTTAGLLERLVREFPQSLKTVRVVICEDHPKKLLGLQARLPDAIKDSVYGIYGWTETGGACLGYPLTGVSEAGNVVEGLHALGRTSLHVLDSRHRPVPTGVPGEIYISGDTLALAYYRLPARSAGSFIPDPFSNERETRLYRTGDTARFRPGERLQFLGRRDRRQLFQRRRIDGGELETLLKQYPGVEDARLVIREDEQSQAGKLVIYWIPQAREPIQLAGAARSNGDEHGAARPTSLQLQNYLAARLPEHMVPSAFVQLESFPLNAEGDLDERQLPAPGRPGQEPAEGFVAPRNETEQAIAAVWRDLLGIERIGVNHNFFDLGGHSFLITRLQSRLNSLFSPAISVLDLFQYPTIEALSERLGKIDKREEKPSPETSGQDRAQLRSRLLQRRARPVG